MVLCYNECPEVATKDQTKPEGLGCFQKSQGERTAWWTHLINIDVEILASFP